MNKMQRIALGAERAKYIWRNREIMSKNGKDSCASLAKDLGVSVETVRRTLNGTLHSPCVLDWLRAKGAPEQYLCAPRSE